MLSVSRCEQVSLTDFFCPEPIGSCFDIGKEQHRGLSGSRYLHHALPTWDFSELLSHDCCRCTAQKWVFATLETLSRLGGGSSLTPARVSFGHVKIHVCLVHRARASSLL